MLTNLDARNAIADAINAGDAHSDNYDLDAIVTAVHEATGGYDIEAMDHDAFWTAVEDYALPLVNVVIMDSETDAAGAEYGLVVAESPNLDTERVREFLAGHIDGTDTTLYALVVPESMWDQDLNGRPRLEVGVNADALQAIVGAA